MDSTVYESWMKKHEAMFRILFILFLGQVVSFLLAFKSFFSSYLANLGVNAPLTQSFFLYLSLTVVYGGILLFRRKKLLVPWYYYLLLAIIDVQGNYLVNKAFQYASITSVTLLDCFTIPWVLILTWAYLGTRYSIWQYIGAAICIVGLGLVFFSDAGVGGGGGSRPLLGDILVIAGTLFYAMSNVGEEFCVKQKDTIEMIAMLGVFGLLVSICEIALLERSNLEAIGWSKDVILGFAGFVVGTFAFCSLFPFLLKLSGTAMFNLSALTSDMWAVVIRVLFYHQEVDWLYYVSSGTVVVGLIIYSKSEKNPIPIGSVVDGHLDGQYQALDEENRESTDEALVT